MDIRGNQTREPYIVVETLADRAIVDEVLDKDLAERQVPFPLTLDQSSRLSVIADDLSRSILYRELTPPAIEWLAELHLKYNHYYEMDD